MSATSLTAESETYLPNADDRRQLMDVRETLAHFDSANTEQRLKESVDRNFNEMSRERDFPTATIKVPGSVPHPLTRELADVLVTVADQLSRGRAVLVAPCDIELTTQAAADMLGISRPTLVKLLESGDIPFTKVGRHRRVLLSDLSNYAKERHAQTLRDLDDLASHADPRRTLDNPLVDKD